MQEKAINNETQENKLKEKLENTLKKGGNVFFSVFNSERMLELLIYLENMWKNNKEISNYNIYFYHNLK